MTDTIIASRLPRVGDVLIEMNGNPDLGMRHYYILGRSDHGLVCIFEMGQDGTGDWHSVIAWEPESDWDIVYEH